MNLYNKMLAVQGYPIKAAMEEMSMLNEFSEHELNAHHERKKWEMYEFHRTHNQWYRGHAGTTATSWEEIPILQKTHLQQPLQVMLSEPFASTKVYKNNTSGSTGIPFFFAKDKYAHAMTWAYIFQKYNETGIEYGRSLQARFFGIPLTRKKYFKERFKDIIAARVRFPIFDLSDAMLEQYLRKFYTKPFEYIYGYTSSLVLFARYVRSREIVLSRICPSLTCCIVTSEVCSPSDREILKESFGIKVINEYGAAELDIIGFENDKQEWVINEENLLLEIVNDLGRPVSAGESGTAVVTSLYNKAMPFIRYALGDVISIGETKTNGRRIITSMQGRVNDVALLPSGKKSPGLTFYYVSKSLLEQSGGLKEFIIKQLKPDHFHFEYVADQPLSADQQQDVRILMDRYLEPNLKATFERKDIIQRTAAGKFKHFYYLVD